MLVTGQCLTNALCRTIKLKNMLFLYTVALNGLITVTSASPQLSTCAIQCINSAMTDVGCTFMYVECFPPIYPVDQGKLLHTASPIAVCVIVPNS